MKRPRWITKLLNKLFDPLSSLEDRLETHTFQTVITDAEIMMAPYSGLIERYEEEAVSKLVERMIETGALEVEWRTMSEIFGKQVRARITVLNENGKTKSQ